MKERQSMMSYAVLSGIELDGGAGTARPNLKRCIPLCNIVLDILETKRSSVGLLEVLAGSFVSIFQMRRRYMSVLEGVYAAQRGRRRKDIIKLSPELVDELLCCLSLTVLTHIDFRLRPSTRIIASDASSTAEAAVSSRVPAELTEELQRHTLQKGLWNRLLQPASAYLREKGELCEERELPDKSYSMTFIWKDLVKSLAFERYGGVRRVKKRRHINIGEIRAALRAEEKLGGEQSDVFYIHLQDSQVSLAALTKGRSSSRALNSEMKKSIAPHTSSGIRPFYGFVRSKLNPMIPLEVLKFESRWRSSRPGLQGSWEETLENLMRHWRRMGSIPCRHQNCLMKRSYPNQQCQTSGPQQRGEKRGGKRREIRGFVVKTEEREER